MPNPQPQINYLKFFLTIFLVVLVISSGLFFTYHKFTQPEQYTNSQQTGSNTTANSAIQASENTPSAQTSSSSHLPATLIFSCLIAMIFTTNDARLTRIVGISGICGLVTALFLTQLLKIKLGTGIILITGISAGLAAASILTVISNCLLRFYHRK